MPSAASVMVSYGSVRRVASTTICVSFLPVRNHFWPGHHAPPLCNGGRDEPRGMAAQLRPAPSGSRPTSTQRSSRKGTTWGGTAARPAGRIFLSTSMSSRTLLTSRWPGKGFGIGRSKRRIGAQRMGCPKAYGRTSEPTTSNGGRCTQLHQK
jgi:hypothetical protein